MSEAAPTSQAARRSSAGRHVRIFRLLACAFLGVLTTVAVAAACSRFIPLQNRGGTVALDGDHLQPWIIELRAPGARRTMWFEKGRIYNRSDRGPQGASSAAVANWSFATATRSNKAFTKGPVALPDSMRQRIAEVPQTVWGLAHDLRGWPMSALKWEAEGAIEHASTTLHRPPSTEIYRFRGGLQFQPQASAVTSTQLGGPAGFRGNLAQLSAFPLIPVWPGFLIDTLAFAGAWWALFAAIALLRSRTRRRQGGCPRCGYDLVGDLSGGCPECGWGRTPAPAPAP